MTNPQHIALQWDSLIQTATPNLSVSTTPADILSEVLLIVFPLAGVVLLIYLIYGGYNWMFSGGDPKKVAQAQGIITNALIGFIIMFASYWIVQFVGETLDLEILRDIF